MRTRASMRSAKIVESSHVRPATARLSRSHVLPALTVSHFAWLALDLNEGIDRDLQRADLAAQAAASDSQHSGGLRLVPFTDAKHARDHVALHEFQSLGIKVGGAVLKSLIDEMPQV